jgi:hypothetical protein
MREIVVLIPEIESEQNVEIEVRINGRKKTLQYRVELLNFEGAGDDAPMKDKVTVLRHRIAKYDKDWELVEIGAPDQEENIPLMFRRRSDKEVIHQSKSK